MATKIKGGGKTKILKGSKEDQNIAALFEQMMNNNMNLQIIHEKYNTIKAACVRFSNVVSLAANMCHNDMVFESKMVEPEFFKMGHDLKTFCQHYISTIDLEFNAPDIDAIVSKGMYTKDSYNAVPEKIAKEFAEKYKFIKNTSTSRDICVLTCGYITTRFRRHLQRSMPPAPGEREMKWVDIPTNELNGRFIANEPDVTISPIESVPSFNIKQLYLACNEENRIMCPLLLRKMLTITTTIVDILNQPDTDPEDFAKIITSSIAKIKKQIRGCDEAFAKLEESVGLLKNNFGAYYKNLVATDNPTIVMEDYIRDVASQPGTTTKVARQFKQIIAYYHKMTDKHKSDPRMASILKKVDQQFSTLEEQTGEKFTVDEDVDVDFDMTELDFKNTNQSISLDTGVGEASTADDTDVAGGVDADEDYDEDDEENAKTLESMLEMLSKMQDGAAVTDEPVQQEPEQQEPEQ